MTSNVEANYIAQPILLMQQNFRDTLPYKPKMLEPYWITGALELFRGFNVRHNCDVGQLLSAQPCNCSPIQ